MKYYLFITNEYVQNLSDTNIFFVYLFRWRKLTTVNFVDCTYENETRISIDGIVLDIQLLKIRKVMKLK